MGASASLADGLGQIAGHVQAKLAMLTDNGGQASDLEWLADPFLSSLISENARHFATESSLNHLCSGWITFGGVGLATSSEGVLSGLVGEVLEGNKAADVLARATALASHGRAGGFLYVALTGATPGHGFELVSDVHLIPWNKLDDSSQKRRLSRDPRIQDFTVGLRPKPNCAVRIRLTERRILYRTAIDGSIKDNRKEYTDSLGLAGDIVRVLNLKSKQPISVLAHWAVSDNALVRRIHGSSFGFEGALNDPALLHIHMRH